MTSCKAGPLPVFYCANAEPPPLLARFSVQRPALGMTVVEVNTNDPLPLFQNSRVEMAVTN